MNFWNCCGLFIFFLFSWTVSTVVPYFNYHSGYVIFFVNSQFQPKGLFPSSRQGKNMGECQPGHAARCPAVTCSSAAKSLGQVNCLTRSEWRPVEWHMDFHSLLAFYMSCTNNFQIQAGISFKHISRSHNYSHVRHVMDMVAWFFISSRCPQESAMSSLTHELCS